MCGNALVLLCYNQLSANHPHKHSTCCSAVIMCFTGKMSLRWMQSHYCDKWTIVWSRLKNFKWRWGSEMYLAVADLHKLKCKMPHVFSISYWDFSFIGNGEQKPLRCNINENIWNLFTIHFLKTNILMFSARGVYNTYLIFILQVTLASHLSHMEYLIEFNEYLPWTCTGGLPICPSRLTFPFRGGKK